MDKIYINGLTLFAYHGVNPEEKECGQKFVLDITAQLDLNKARISDNLDDTVSYAKMLKRASAIFLSQKDDLLERAAERVAAGLLEEFDKLYSVTVLLKKPDAPIKADFDYVAVEITKTRTHAVGAGE